MVKFKFIDRMASYAAIITNSLEVYLVAGEDAFH